MDDLRAALDQRPSALRSTLRSLAALAGILDSGAINFITTISTCAAGMTLTRCRVRVGDPGDGIPALLSMTVLAGAITILLPTQFRHHLL